MTSPKFFKERQVRLSDGSYFYEIITPNGERVASAESWQAISDTCLELNETLTIAEQRRPTDFVVNV